MPDEEHDVPRRLVEKTEMLWDNDEQWLRKRRKDDRVTLWIGESEDSTEICLLDPSCLEEIPSSEPYWPESRGYTGESYFVAAAAACEKIEAVCSINYGLTGGGEPIQVRGLL